MRKILFVLVCLLLTSCLEPVRPTPEQMANPDCGPYPDNYEKLIEEHLKKVLFDPYTVRDLNITKPWGCYYQPNLYSPFTFGYCFSVSLNAKNRYGAYVGIKDHDAFIRNDSLYFMSERTQYYSVPMSHANCERKEKL
jgi:hypothetical protein